MAPKLTILAPTHNRPDVLAQVWPSWLAQDGLAEIVIVNDGSTDPYDAVFAALAVACQNRDIRLTIVTTPTRLGAPAAKNAGLARCTGDEVLTTDDDIILPDDMVRICREHRPEAPHPVLVGPRVIYLRDGESNSDALARSDRETQRYFDLSRLLLCAWANPGQVTQFPFVTAVALWPASLFRDGLRFHEAYGGNGYREESDPQLQASMTFGAKVFLVPQATCFHLSPSVAYAKKGGQRRGGRLWFEIWVLRNNCVFLRRFAPYLKREFGISPIGAWLRLAGARMSPARVLRAFRAKGG